MPLVVGGNFRQLGRHRPTVPTVLSLELLVARLKELRPAERAAYLRQVCQVDSALAEQARELAALLVSGVLPESLQSVGAFLPGVNCERRRILELALDTEESAPSQIGPYHLLERIGEGGFGFVWRAEQQSPVRRRVALKILKPGMDSHEVIARFESERQALALMEHAHIARVLDAGETDDGRPYFVMEFVPGVPLTRYCDDHRLPMAERLRLFVLVCQAVQHAHQKGVIHRDLKPSNILVADADGQAWPKVIDFGIAKAIEAPLTDDTLRTRLHTLLGTPAYMSPEQLDSRGQDVDTRSDIYSLGVLFYELAVSVLPFDPDVLARSGVEGMRRTIAETDPPRPSIRLRNLAETERQRVARQRSTEPARMEAALRGELDWVIMRCLEKERSRRYDTAADLAADVQRYLRHEPITARPPSAPYRLRKFVRRHTLATAVVSLLSVSLLSGLVMGAATLRRETAARDREAALRQQADANAARAQAAAMTSAQVALFMQNVFQGVAPSASLGRDTTMLRDILKAAETRLATELRGQPTVAAALQVTLGTVHHDLGNYTESEPLLRAAVATLRAEPSSSHLDLATALHHWGATLRRLNQPLAADAALREALALRQRDLGSEHPAIAETLLRLCEVPHADRPPARIEELLHEVFRIRLRAFGPDDVRVAEAMSALGAAARARLDHERAAALYRDALAVYRRHFGNDHPAVAQSLDNLAFSLTHSDPPVDSDGASREAFMIRRRLFGDQHPQVAAALLRFAAEVVPGDADGIALVQDFVASQRQQLAPGSTLLAPSLLAMASLLDQPEGDPARARELIDEAHHLLASTPNLEPALIQAMLTFAWSKFTHRLPDAGRVMGETVLTLAEAAFGPNGGGTLQPVRTLGWIYLATGRHEEAARQFERAIALDESHFGPWHVFTLADTAALGAMYRATGRSKEARQLLQDAVARAEANAAVDPHSIPLAPVLTELGLTLVHDGDFEAAEPVLRRALVQHESNAYPSLARRIHPRGRALSGLGQALAGQGRWAEAESLLTQAYSELDETRHHLAGDSVGIVAQARKAVVAFYEGRGQTDLAAQWARHGSTLITPPDSGM